MSETLTPTVTPAAANILAGTRGYLSKALDPDQLFPSAALRELEVRLHHLLELRGIGIAMGESGSGKTTACRKIVAGLHAGLHCVLYVSLTGVGLLLAPALVLSLLGVAAPTDVWIRVVGALAVSDGANPLLFAGQNRVETARATRVIHRGDRPLPLRSIGRRRG